ncbi:NADH-dependent phenylglyoxylate dehydrogenase subunit alpha [Azospirillum sp. TSO22-1]|uniref:NADH-dependent phenylglyoxylate dehydrogenase subunit alpha n=1 Tax=Azospirillum sp. TSO22-1 TaxID=716789 RepID=UPI000D615A05|nr:phenylglyoxylate dehydrogenase [Azospirillum sp. TSO22-1]PWC52502.1 phenylglyoxylate dehydrogenase [Azospirillum sp. TSO22-1]
MADAAALLPNAPKTIVCDGNEAAAWGVVLSRPDVVAVYPITPQSSLVEYVSQFIADGTLDAELLNLEGEHSVLSALQGAALAGARTYTATCGPGLAFMFEPYVRTPGLRLPMVASLVTRDMLTPQCVWGGQQDAMTVRDCGWIHMYCETVQEVLDTTIMAYRIAEHRDVMLPVNVNHDGNYLSYGVARAEMPAQAAVDGFLGVKDVNWHAALDPLRPMAIDPLTGGAGGPGPSMFVRYRKGLCNGMRNALRVIEETHAEWGRLTGRHHAPLIEEYRLDDAEVALVTIGSMTGAAKDAVDALRSGGKRVGLIKVKTMRPFPVEAMARALSKVNAVAVVDRAVSYGWNAGPVYQETLGALYRARHMIPAVSVIGGLAGADITDGHFARCIGMAFAAAASGQAPDGPVWLNEND